MAQVKKVLMTVNQNAISINPNEVTLNDGDQIVFVAGDSNVYTVIIPGSEEDLASDNFDTQDAVIIGDISRGSSLVTPAPNDNIDNGPDGLVYRVIASTNGGALNNDTNAPPKIIIKTD